MTRAVAIVPCTDVDEAQAFFARLGFACEADYGDYRLLADGDGSEVHLRAAVGEGLDPARNAAGLYLYRDDVEVLADAFAGEIIGGGASARSWGMIEFAVNGPDGMLVRIGRPIATP